MHPMMIKDKKFYVSDVCIGCGTGFVWLILRCEATFLEVPYFS